MWRHYANLPRPVHILCLGTFVNRVGTLVIIFLSRYIDEVLDLGVQFATLTLGVYGFGALLASIVGGHLADHIGRRFVMLIALFGGAGVLLLFSRVHSPPAILATAFIFSFVGDMYRPAASAMIADLVPPEQRTYAFGLVYFSINLGVSVSPIIGGIIAKYSYAWLFWGDAATSAAYGVIILLAIKETLVLRPASLPKSQPGESAPSPAEDLPRRIPLMEAMRRILADRTYVTFLIGSFLISLVYMQHLSTLPLYMKDFGIGPEVYGRLIAINAIMIVVLQLPAVSFFSRFQRGSMVALGSLAVGIGFGLTGLAAGTLHFAGAIVIWTIGELMQAPFMQAIVSDMAPKELRGRYMGVFSMTFSASLMIGSPIGGWVLSKFGGTPIWAGCFALGLASMLVYLSIRGKLAVGSASER